MKQLQLSILLVMAITVLGTAQDDPGKDIMKDGSIDEQFEHVMKNSYKYNEDGKSYRVVRTRLLTQLSSNVDKAIKGLETDLNASNKKIDEQGGEIESLKLELQSTNDKLAKVNKEKNNMSLFGAIAMKKAAYRAIMWAIIIGLIAMLAIFIVSFLRSNAVTKQTKRLLEKTREEFEAYRKKSMEDELVLRRKLQTEINKNLS